MLNRRNWLSNLFAPKNSRRQNRPVASVGMESLEQKKLLTALTITSNVPGSDVTIDGQQYTTPVVIDRDPGEQIQLGLAGHHQSVGGEHFAFSSWSNGTGMMQAEQRQPSGHMMGHMEHTTNSMPHAAHGMRHTAMASHGTSSSVISVTVGEHDTTVSAMFQEHAMGHQPHGGHGVKHGEHMALFDLVPHAEATSVVIADGSWSDASIWLDGQVPGDGTKVLITEDRTVEYDIVSEARVDWIRVDGTLRFATDVDTKLIVDTLITSAGSLLEVGTEANPIQADKVANIVIADNGAIDKEWDPQELSRGLITHGTIRMYGAEKLEHTTLDGDAYAGDNELVLSEVPLGWRVGDTLVLGGTYMDDNGSDDDNSRFHDEVLTITAIDGNRIQFTNDDITDGNNAVLRYDHTRPEGYEDAGLKLYVANTTRNIRVESEHGRDTALKQRGHVMVMHAPGARVYHAGFYNLGRTDKSRVADDNGVHPDGSMGFGTNQRGRYGFHLHRTGANLTHEDTVPQADGSVHDKVSVVHGISVVDTPGWGIVHHEGAAVLENNVVFDVAGAAIVAEAGNEIGIWRNNLTIKNRGDGFAKSPDHGLRSPRFDFGFDGHGYWCQGSCQVRMFDNTAISSNFAGMDFFATFEGARGLRDAETIPATNLPPELRHIVSHPSGQIDVGHVPLAKNTGFTVYNANRGFGTWRHMRNDDGQLAPNVGLINGNAHDERGTIEDFRVWGVNSGAFLLYTTGLDLKDGWIIGDRDNPIPFSDGNMFEKQGFGVSSNGFAQDQRFINLHVEGFDRGIKLTTEGRVRDDDSVPFAASHIVGGYLDNNVNLFRQNGIPNDPQPFSSNSQIVGTTFVSTDGNIAPTADFDYENIGQAGVVSFDASDSFDSDPELGHTHQRNEMYWQSHLTGNAIASYGWDFDNDGAIDQYGRKVNRSFEAGQHDVSLTVWDNQGETTTVTRTIDVESAEQNNILRDSTFDGELAGGGHYFTSTRHFEDNWVATGFELNEHGQAELTGGPWNAALGQVVADYKATQGIVPVSVELANTEGDSFENDLRVRITGINGQFGTGVWATGWEDGALPVEATTLLDESLGGETFDLQKFEWNVDVGDGYQFIVAQITGRGASAARGDRIVVDNFFVGSGSRETSDLNSHESSYSAIDEGLLAHYTMNEGFGRVVNDNSPADFRSATFWRPEWTDGVDGDAVRLNGDNWVHLNPTRSSARDTYEQFAVSIRFKVDDLAPGFEKNDFNKQVILDHGDVHQGVNVYVDGGQLYVGGWNRGARWNGTFLSTDQIEAGRWHTVTLSLDGGRTVQSDAFVAWLDGEEIGRGDGAWVRRGVGNAIGQTKGSTRFHDGHHHFRGAPHRTVGAVDDLRLYGRALSADEAAELASIEIDQPAVAPATVSMVASDVTASESGDTAAFTVTRDGGSIHRALTVEYTVDGTAVAGEDYEGLTGTVTFEAFQTEATIELTAIDDDATEEIETVALSLVASEAVSLADDSVATAIIADNDIQLDIADQATTSGATLIIDLPGVQSETASYSVEVHGDELHSLDQEYGFFVRSGVQRHNERAELRGHRKWLQGNWNGRRNKWFYIDSNGDLYKNKRTGGILIASLGRDVYDNLDLLTEAQLPPVRARVEDGRLVVSTPEGFTGQVRLSVTLKDGSASTQATFTLDVTAPPEAEATDASVTDEVFSNLNLQLI